MNEMDRDFILQTQVDILSATVERLAERVEKLEKSGVREDKVSRTGDSKGLGSLGRPADIYWTEERVKEVLEKNRKLKASNHNLRQQLSLFGPCRICAPGETCRGWHCEMCGISDPPGVCRKCEGRIGNKERTD